MSRVSTAKSYIISFFSLIVTALLIINLFHYSANTNPVTITSTLEFISRTSSSFTIPSINDMIAYFTIPGEWAILDGFRLFLNGLGSLLGTASWVVSSLIFTLTFAVKLMFFILG